MKKYFIILTFLLLVPFSFTFAHPGNTDSSGCHTCRTNCSSWGLSYGEYHCHNNKGSSQPLYPVTSTHGSGGTGYTTPAPNYAYPSTYSTTPSCPSNSYASGSSCKCNYGYIVSGSSCVSGDSVCHSELGYGSSYDDLSNKCKCNYGYVIGNSGQCVTTSSYCTSQLGLMSRYDSLSKKCECMSGYEYNGSSCVYKSSNYSDVWTYPSYSETSSNCPANSSESSTDADMCTCNIGYQTNSAKDGCIKAPTKSNDQICQDSFGSNVFYNGTENSDDTVNCNCKSGYQWNTGKTSCVLTPITPIIQSNKKSESVMDIVEVPVSKDFEVNDSDITILDSTGILKDPATFRKCPSTECSVIRYYAETSELPITGSTPVDNSIWYRIDGTTDTGGTGQSITGWIYGTLFETVIAQTPTATTTPEKIEGKQGWFTRFLNWFR